VWADLAGIIPVACKRRMIEWTAFHPIVGSGWIIMNARRSCS
jgi:hypothetical protein